MRIFAGVPSRGASNDSGVAENGNFQRFRWLFFSETLEMKLAYTDMQSIVNFPKMRNLE